MYYGNSSISNQSKPAVATSVQLIHLKPETFSCLNENSIDTIKNILQIKVIKIQKIEIQEIVPANQF